MRALPSPGQADLAFRSDALELRFQEHLIYLRAAAVKGFNQFRFWMLVALVAR